MIKALKRILTFLGVFLFYFIVKEFIELYNYIKGVHPYAGYVYLVVIAAVIIFYIIVPLIKIWRIPSFAPPVNDKSKIDELIQSRLLLLQKSGEATLLKPDSNITPLELYSTIMANKKEEVSKVRKKYITGVFYSTSISQNGFLDALLVFVSGINLIRETFIIYQGRMTGKDLWQILKRIYFSAAVASTESVEYVVNELYTKLATEGVKGIPFLNKVIGSLADGYINAALLTRVSLITENYCTILYYEKERDLYPNIKTVTSVTKDITTDLVSRVSKTLKDIAVSKIKSSDTVIVNNNPVKYIFDKIKNEQGADIETQYEKSGIFTGLNKFFNYMKNK